MIPILSKSQETKYRQKCKDLKRRIQEIEDFNEATALNLARTKRAIIRVRLERELLMEKLEELAKGSAEGNNNGADDSTDDEVEVGLSELQRALLLRANEPPPSASSARAASNNKASQAGTAAALAAIASVQGKGGSTNDDEAAAATENGNGGGDGSESPKKRVVRNPDMPKRPQNAYIIFCEREKEGVKASMEAESGETFDLTRALADSWKELGQEGRQPYYKLYQDDRRRYLEEMSEYVPENPSEAEQKEIQRAIKALEELKNGKGGDEDEEVEVKDKEETKEKETKEGKEVKEVKEEPKEEASKAEEKKEEAPVDEPKDVEMGGVDEVVVKPEEANEVVTEATATEAAPTEPASEPVVKDEENKD